MHLYSNRHARTCYLPTANSCWVILISTMILCAISLMALPNQAHAYALNGSKWAKASQTIQISDISGKYKNALNLAVIDYSSNTDVTLKTSTKKQKWTAEVSNYGKTGWEGISEWSLSKTNYVTKATSKVNKYYASGYSTECLKVLWDHELGHVWGLGHVMNSKRVMYISASKAYKEGVRALTSDEKKGINRLY